MTETRKVAAPRSLRLPPWRLPLAHGVLVARYKRFLADVRLADGRRETVHCPNPGAMLGLDRPGSPVVVSDSGDPRRRLRRTLELVQVDDGGGRAWVGVNTQRANAWVEQAISAGVIPGLPRRAAIEREVHATSDNESGRLDLRLAPQQGPRVWVEVKNATLGMPGAHGVEALFPDTLTVRGARHLRLLAAAAQRGERAWTVYLVNRGDARSFRPAAEIDPAYAQALAAARAAGVRVAALQVRHRARRTATGLSVASTLTGTLPVPPVRRKGYPAEPVASL